MGIFGNIDVSFKICVVACPKLLNKPNCAGYENMSESYICLGEKDITLAFNRLPKSK